MIGLFKHRCGRILSFVEREEGEKEKKKRERKEKRREGEGGAEETTYRFPSGRIRWVTHN
jgi:hypothetical protein